MIKKNRYTGEEKLVAPFTDDDLKRLKESGCVHIDWATMEALLARLEAAKQICKSVTEAGILETWEIEAWRKAAGKEQE